MANITYQLRAAYVGAYTGGTIRVADDRSYNVGAALTAGGGTITVPDSDHLLTDALDAYPPLQRTGSAAAPTVPPPPTTLRRMRLGRGADPGETVLQAGRDTDLYNRFEVDVDGNIRTGSGAAAPSPFSAGSGGALGAPEVFVQDTAPSAPYPHIWVVTDAFGTPTGEIRAQGGGARGPIAADAIQALVDQKGDLLVGSAPDLLARLAAGSNGQALTADSTAPTGLAWQGLGKVSMPYVTGQWYTTPRATGQTAAAVILNRLYFLPFEVLADSATFDQIGVSLGAAASAGGIAKLGVYAPGTGLGIGALLGSAQVATDSISPVDRAVALGLTLTRGFYWLAAAFQVSVTGLTVQRLNYPSGPPVPAPGMSVTGYGWRPGDNTSGAQPDPGGTLSLSAGTVNGPAVWLRAA